MNKGEKSLWKPLTMHDSSNQEAGPEVVNCGAGCAYQILDLIDMLGACALYRARSVQDGRSAVVKLLDSDSMRPEQIAGFRREFEILHSLDVPGVVKPIALVDQPRRLLMILEDVAGEPFEAVLTRQRLEWPVCRRLACQLTRILAALHAAGLTHQDMRPANLLLSSAQNLCLMDLRRATCIEPQTGAIRNQSEADWAYISPEQTGRMNRAVDYRTDFYSLGVMLYRMLTGQLPFHANDALEWAHCHLARLPRPPGELCPHIPPMLSAIVMKLLAKMPEDRYQRAQGLLHDLETCQEQGGTHGNHDAITPFALGSHDWSERLQIPHTLFGREAEFQQLLASFEAMAASGRAALLLVSGDAGVGKSALVQELHQPIVARHGYFISGKFDQYQRDIPYATVTQAFRELVQLILAEGDARIADWRRQIAEAVGVNGQLIVDVLPQVELIIGVQAPVPELPPAEAQNRFRIVFEQFIGVFAQPAHPLMLFLDDLQWADASSLRLVQDLVASFEQRFLLVVGAYRDNEVSEAGPTHPLTMTLASLHSEGTTMTQIALTPLSEAALCALLGTMLHCAHGTAVPLAHLIYQKTAGNPFFVIQFMTVLADEGMITFDAAARTWRWDLAKICAKGYTDNVADLMIDKLTRLPVLAQAALQRLACLGSCAPEALLVMVCEQPKAQVVAALAAAVNAGLLLHANGSFRFSHDRVQEAAYLSTMPPPARAALHEQIGRLLMIDKTPAQIEQAVFAIVSQFNRGAACMTDPGDQALLCQLNFLAGKKAKAAVAYSSARHFLDRAHALLPADAWQAQYPECFALTLALSESEYLVGNYQRADQLAHLILANAQSNGDRARVYRLRTHLYQMAGRYDDALATMVEAARLFEVVFPAAGAEMEAAIDAEVRDIALFLQGRRIAEFVDAAPLTDADMEMVIALLVEAIPAAYLTRPDYFAFLTARATNLSLRYGHTEDACFAYSTYGMALLSRNSDIATAFEFSELALQLNDKLGGRRLKGRLKVAHALAFNPWKNTFASSTPILDEAFAASLEVGDLLYANFSALFYFWPMLQQGIPLDMVLDTAKRYGAFARGSHNDAVYHTIRFQQQLVANLKGQTHGPASLDDDDFDEAACFPVLEKTNMGFGLQMAHIVKQISAFIYGDYPGALAAAQLASLKSYQGNGMILVDSSHHYYFALTLTALYQQASAEEQRRFAGLLAEELERHKVWAEHCPQNFLNTYALVGAEVARIEGRDSDAEQLYERAIGSAHESGFIQKEAIAFELASKFYRARGFALFADTYLREARACYSSWGAEGKVAQLDEHYPQLRPPLPSAAGLDEGSATIPLDVLSVTKASQAISGQLVLSELADTLLQIVVENAGAQTGSLLLSRGEGWTLVAHTGVDQAATQVRFYGRQAPAENSLPVAILNYVKRSREPVVLADVAQQNRFSTDAYFAGHQPKSVLCLPILRQDALIGLLYMENNLVTDAFAPQRVAVLKLLASQAAISLENAQLYANLLNENHERKQAEEQVNHMAHHDALTGLPNRVLFQDRMNQAIAYAHRNQSQVGVLFIDLDHFKNINDSLGHHIGDVLLQMAARRLQHCLRKGDSVARLGGDEFVLSLPLLSDSKDAAQVAQKALDALAQPFIVEGHELHVNGSIGISLYPDDGTDVDTLMRSADTAMYHAKEKGRGNFQFFTPELNEATQQRRVIGARLRQALAQNEFVLHYQPQVDMETGITFSAEALLRWQPPGSEPISCGSFISNAEESGLIVPIGEWTLRQACKQLKIWHDAGHAELKMAVNLSPRQLEQADFCNLVAHIVEEAEISASDLELEITESILMQHNEATLAKLTTLSHMGIQLSVDDFGTGYSSLAYLQRFPVHALKIDQSFVRDIGIDQNDTALVTAIIAMANSLQLKVIAEGVETLQQAQFLLAHDCQAAQGFYYSQAVPAETLSGMLRSNATLKIV